MRICSRHFTPEDYKNPTTLHGWAVPTRSLPSDGAAAEPVVQFPGSEDVVCVDVVDDDVLFDEASDMEVEQPGTQSTDASQGLSSGTREERPSDPIFEPRSDEVLDSSFVSEPSVSESDFDMDEGDESSDEDDVEVPTDKDELIAHLQKKLDVFKKKYRSQQVCDITMCSNEYAKGNLHL